jgi:adenine-specific DNA-methyltransferase
MAKNKPAPTKVESIRHKDKRKNIPTEELRDFVRDDEHSPKTMLYPRDPSLDPQLVWKGKDEQDRADLAVPVVPIYIQEKIHPQAIIDALPRLTPEARQPDLFADFNGLPEDFGQRVEFYKHDGHWSNRMILGDSLLVMTSLAEKEGLKGKVQTIYIDPPYGIKFGSNWQVSTRKRDVKDGKAEDATRQPEQVRAFRDTWQLGIHSYLAYLRDRLVAARELLTESGSIFVQIGDENVHLVRCVMDEVFGAENTVSFITYCTTTARRSQHLNAVADKLLWYSKCYDQLKSRRLFLQKKGPEADPFYKREQDGRWYYLRDLSSQGESNRRAFEFDGRVFVPPKGRGWSVDPATLPGDRLVIAGNYVRVKIYWNEFPASPLSDLWTDTQFAGDKFYVVQTHFSVIERCLLMTTDPGDLVLDPTCGSGTTVFVAEQWGRRWITCDTSRVALALARTRLMAAKYPYYLLADSPEGIKKEAELTGKMPPPYPTENDIKKGFVYKRVPHVTLKSIANNPDIKEGMTREQIDAAIARHAENRDTLRPALRGQQARPRLRAVLRRKPFTAPDDQRRGKEGRIRALEVRPKHQGHRARQFRANDPRQPQESRRAEHSQGGAAEIRHGRGLPRRVDSRRRDVYRGRRQAETRRDLHRPGARHGRRTPDQGSCEGSGQRGRVRRADRLRLRLRPGGQRGGEALRQVGRAAGQDEP